jgi:hypothetical protein
MKPNETIIWIIIHTLLMIKLIYLCLTDSSEKILRALQIWVYIVEIYYIVLFLITLTTRFQNRTFLLWNADVEMSTILSRQLTSYALYQIRVMV